MPPRSLRCAALSSLLQIAATAWGAAGPAAAAEPAELGVGVSVASQDRLRGYALSTQRPVARVDLTYDAPSGLYMAGGASMVATEHDGLQPYSLQLNLGYSGEVKGAGIVDLGYLHADYSKYIVSNDAMSYDDVYVGLTVKSISAHLHYSPKYLSVSPPFFGSSRSGSVYLDLATARRLTDHLRATAHFGEQAQTGGSLGLGRSRAQYDWSLGLVASLRALEAGVSLTGSGPDKDFYDGRLHSRTAVIASITRTF